MQKSRLIAAAAAALLLCVAALAWRWSAAPTPERSVHGSDAPARSARLRWKWAPQRAGDVPDIQGHVRDHEGRALANAIVCARPRRCFDNVLCTDERCATSSAQGAYALFALGPNSFEVSASAAGHVPQSHAVPLHIERDERYQAIDFLLAASLATIAGTVRDATGGVVAEAMVQQVSTESGQLRSTALSDSEGAFTLEALPGPVMLLASADGYASTRLAVAAPAAAISLTLTPAARIAGRVVEKGTDEPLADVTIHAEGISSDVSAERANVRSDAEGRFAFDRLQPGTYRLHGASDRFRIAPAREVTLTLAQTSDVVLEAEAATAVRGLLVMQQDGARCPVWGRATLERAREGAPPPAGPMQARGLPESHVRIPPGEPVVMTGARPGRYDVHVSCGNYPLVAGPASIEIGATPIEGVRWEFGAAARLVVRARDGAGKPVRDVTLYVASKETPTDPFTGALTDAAGQGEVHGLVAGAYVVSAPLVPGQPSTEIRIRPNDREAQAELVIDSSTSLEVRVVTPEGAPFGTATVIAEERLAEGAGRPPNAQQALAMGNGLYRFHPILAGTYVVTVLDSINPPVRASAGGAARDDEPQAVVTVRASEPAELRVVYGGYDAQLTGYVLDPRGAPAENAWVEATAVGQKGMNLPPIARSRAYTDAHGAFSIEGLRPNAAFDLRVGGTDGVEVTLPNVFPGDVVRIALPAAARVGGSIVDERGEVPAEFSVSVASLQAGSSRSAMFRETGGKWTLSGVAPGQVSLNAGIGSTVASEVLELKPGEERMDLVLVLRSPQAAVP